MEDKVVEKQTLNKSEELTNEYIYAWAIFEKVAESTSKYARR